jgi:hypothetical protein
LPTRPSLRLPPNQLLSGHSPTVNLHVRVLHTARGGKAALPARVPRVRPPRRHKAHLRRNPLFRDHRRPRRLRRLRAGRLLSRSPALPQHPTPRIRQQPHPRSIHTVRSLKRPPTPAPSAPSAARILILGARHLPHPHPPRTLSHARRRPFAHRGRRLPSYKRAMPRRPLPKVLRRLRSCRYHATPSGGRAPPPLPPPQLRHHLRE